MMRQIPLPLPHDAAMGADDFLITSSNQEAVAWINRWPTWPSHGLILSGLGGSGKSHLLNLWLENTKGHRLTVDHLLTHDLPTLTADGSCIAFDNADAHAGQSKVEEKLFHLFNHIKSIQGSLLLTMTTAAGQAGFLLPDLRSRLIALPAVTLGPPDDDLMAALIVKQFRDRQVALDDGVISYLIPRAKRDAAGIRELVTRLDQAALSASRKITVAFARTILEDIHD